MGYIRCVFEIRKTDEFSAWMRALKDKKVRRIIGARIERLSYGNAGDVKPVGAGVSELRIHYGAGYRVYFTKQDNVIVIILCGGTKKRQAKDIEWAKKLARILTG